MNTNKKNKTAKLNSQVGASMGGILFNVVIIMILGFAAAKIGAFYLDNNTINNALQDLNEVPYITKKSKREVVELLGKRFSMNNTPVAADEIFIDKRSDRLIIDINYERRVNMFANIDAVVSFENHFEAVRR
jgi:hypothetical protein